MRQRGTSIDDDPMATRIYDNMVSEDDDQRSCTPNSGRWRDEMKPIEDDATRSCFQFMNVFIVLFRVSR